MKRNEVFLTLQCSIQIDNNAKDTLNFKHFFKRAMDNLGSALSMGFTKR